MAQLNFDRPRRQTLGTIAAGFVLCALSVSAIAQTEESVDSKWGTRLMERFRYYDMAEKVFTRLSTRQNADQRMEGFFGLAQLRRQLALNSAENLEARQKYNDESLEMLRKVCKEISVTNPKHWSAQFELADLLQDLASEVVEQIARGSIPVDKLEAVRAKAKNGLDEAQVIYEKAKAKFEAVDREKDEEGWFNGRRAMLFGAVLRLRKAELIASDPTKRGSVIWDNELTEADKALEKFIWNHEDQFIGQLAYMWQGRVLGAMFGFKQSVAATKVEDRYLAAINNLITRPPEKEERDPDDEEEVVEWRPAAPEHQQLAQQAYWWMLQFLNEKQLTAKAIEHGTKMRTDWKELKYPYHVFGRMAMVELARAFQAEGRDGDALSLASEISAAASDAAKAEADKLVSVIIKTSTDKSQFSPTVLAAGANGAFLAKRREGDNTKDFECVELYQLVLENLPQIADETTRNDLGALAWYRIGVCFDRLGRGLESLVAFENGYRNFNTEKLKEDPKITETLKNAYIYSARQFKRAHGTSAYAKSVQDEAEKYVIAHPPKNVIGGGVDELQYNKGLQVFGEQKFDEAKQIFQGIADRVSPFKERAMVKLALCDMRLMRSREDISDKEWLATAANFQKFKDYTRATPENDPERVAARTKALAEADYYLTQCYINAVAATTDLAQKKSYFQTVYDLTAAYDATSATPDLVLAMMWNKFQALEGLGRTDECEAVYLEMFKLDPNHQTTSAANVKTAAFLKAKFEAMPVDTADQRAAFRDVKARCAEYYKRYVVAKRPKKLAQWTLVTNMLQDIEDWDGAQALLEDALKEFEGTKNAEEKDIFGLKRRIGRCLIAKAKIALNSGDEASTRTLFDRAAKIYDAILKDPNSPIKGYVSVQEEAAEIYGGFLTGPNQRGQYVYYPGNGEYKKGVQTWEEALKKLRATKEPESPADRADLENRKTQAHFNILMLTYQVAKTESSDQTMKWLRGQLNALFARQPNVGGEVWNPKYQWLNQQVSN